MDFTCIVYKTIHRVTYCVLLCLTCNGYKEAILTYCVSPWNPCKDYHAQKICFVCFRNMQLRLILLKMRFWTIFLRINANFQMILLVVFILKRFQSEHLSMVTLYIFSDYPNPNNKNIRFLKTRSDKLQ